MLLGDNIEIRTIEISDYLVYIKAQRTSNLTEIVSTCSTFNFE